MTLASDISTTSTSLSDIKNAIIAKGVTPSGNITTYAAAIANIPTGGGEFQLQRISDDGGNEIGTHYMNFEDANGNKFKVICLDAQYRNGNIMLWSTDTSNIVTNMPVYNNSLTGWWYDNAKETATTNTQLILDYNSSSGQVSTICNHCRGLSFTVNGTTYYGQVPNMREVFDMWHYRNQIETMDTSATTSTSTNFSSSRAIWSSNQINGAFGWYMSESGQITSLSKNTSKFVCPVLEIPA